MAKTTQRLPRKHQRKLSIPSVSAQGREINTDHKKVEEQIEFQARLLEVISQAVAVIDMDGRITYWNHAAENMFGWPADQIIGRKAVELLLPAETVHQARKIFAHILRTGNIWGNEVLLRRRDNDTFWGDSAAAPIYDKDHHLVRVLAVASDITAYKLNTRALQESNSQNELLFDESPIAILLVACDGKIIRANRAYLQLVGIAPEQVIGTRLCGTGLLPDAEIKKVKQALGVKHAQPAKITTVENLLTRPDGKSVMVESQVFVLGDEETQYVLISIADITIFKEAEEALRQANIELGHSARLKDEFLANMSHELRTPLNTMISLIESMLDGISGALNEKQLLYLRVMNESAHHLLDLINDVLDLSKIGAGKIDLEPDHVPVIAITETALRMTGEMALKKNIHVSQLLDPQVKSLYVDERRIKQVLVNLLSNAIKFTDPGKKIGIEICGEPEAQVATICVWDTGIGIAPENMQYLFKPFMQINAGLNREYPGTGLGLALVYQFVRLHNGSVSVESEPGKGSRFTITLPWTPETPPVDRTAAAQEAMSGAWPPPGHPGRLLLVEDTEATILALKDYLESMGHEVLVAKDGLTGVQMAFQHRPDLILMDVQMPVMNGLEATIKIRALPELAETPIIALTALAMPGDREACLAAGMNEYVSKPIEMHNLVQLIHAYLTRKKE